MKTMIWKICRVLCIGIAVLLLPFAVAAQDDTSDETAETETTEVQSCAECHIDTVAEWQETAHANAFGADFQAVWDGEGDCLSCHATDYQAFSGEYTHEGVACEACHGATPVNHPEEPVAQIDGLETCAECHTTTYHEWEGSPHGAAEMPCTSCHNPHAQELRLETATLLCSNCHEDAATTGYVHVTHVEQECTDCHWHRGTFDAETHYATGELSASGHDAQVETLACIDCHEDLDGEAVAMAGEDGEAGEETVVPSGLAARIAVEELEAEIETVRALGENTAAVRLMQGGVVGLALGAIVAFLLTRLRPGRVSSSEDLS